MKSLQRDFLPSDLQPLIKTAGLTHSIAVQARETLEETAWLLSLADENPIITGVVGWVDLLSPSVNEQLEQFTGHEKFVGVRHVLQGEPDDRYMLRKDFMRGLRVLAEYNLTYDLLLQPRHLPIAVQLLEQFPDQPFVLDHIAKPFIKDGILSPWESDIRQLAAFPNVMCKMSGMVTEADWSAWKPDDFLPYLDVVFDSFGPDRIMFGTDWPVCTVAGSYQQVVDLAAGYASKLTDDEQRVVFGGTAARFYGVSL